MKRYFYKINESGFNGFSGFDDDDEDDVQTSGAGGFTGQEDTTSDDDLDIEALKRAMTTGGKAARIVASNNNDTTFVEDVITLLRTMFGLTYNYGKGPVNRQLNVVNSLSNLKNDDCENKISYFVNVTANSDKNFIYLRDDNFIKRPISNNVFNVPVSPINLIPLFIGNLVIKNADIETLPTWFPKKIEGNLTIINCNLTSLENMPTEIAGTLEIDCPNISDADFDAYYDTAVIGKILENRHDNYVNAIVESRLAKSYAYDNAIVESRSRTVGNAKSKEHRREFFSKAQRDSKTKGFQSSALRDLFGPELSNIPGDAIRVKRNHEAFDYINDYFPIIWTEITNAQVKTYKDAYVYNKVTDLIKGAKETEKIPGAKSEKHYGLMIFTNEDNVITYVMAGSKAGFKEQKGDTVYFKKTVQGMLYTRLERMLEAKKYIEDLNFRFNELNTGTEDMSADTRMTIAGVVGRFVYLGMCMMHSPGYKRALPLLSDIFDPNLPYLQNGLSGNTDLFDNIRQKLGLCEKYGTGSRSTEVIGYTHPDMTKANASAYAHIRFTGDTQDWDKFYRTTVKDKAEVNGKSWGDILVDLVNPDLLTHILLLADIRVNKNGVKSYSKSISNFLRNGDTEGIRDIYHKGSFTDDNGKTCTIKDMEIRYSLLFNMSAINSASLTKKSGVSGSDDKLGALLDWKKRVEEEHGGISLDAPFTIMSLLMLVPDEVSRLYWITPDSPVIPISDPTRQIEQLPTYFGNTYQLDADGNIALDAKGNKIKVKTDLEDDIEAFTSDAAVAARRKNFDVGRLSDIGGNGDNGSNTVAAGRDFAAMRAIRQHGMQLTPAESAEIAKLRRLSLSRDGSGRDVDLTDPEWKNTEGIEDMLPTAGDAFIYKVSGSVPVKRKKGKLTADNGVITLPADTRVASGDIYTFVDSGTVELTSNSFATIIGNTNVNPGDTAIAYKWTESDDDENNPGRKIRTTNIRWYINDNTHMAPIFAHKDNMTFDPAAAARNIQMGKSGRRRLTGGVERGIGLPKDSNAQASDITTAKARLMLKNKFEDSYKIFMDRYLDRFNKIVDAASDNAVTEAFSVLYHNMYCCFNLYYSLIVSNNLFAREKLTELNEFGNALNSTFDGFREEMHTILTFMRKNQASSSYSTITSIIDRYAKTFDGVSKRVFAFGKGYDFIEYLSKDIERKYRALNLGSLHEI